MCFISILTHLASALDRRDEVPNIALAREIVSKNDTQAIAELVEGLAHKKSEIQNDCIKVLYEIGALKPKLISEYYVIFVAILNHKNNRLQWGGMTALNTLVKELPEQLFYDLPKIISAAEKGSVITKDNLMAILLQFCTIQKYASDAFALFNEQLSKSLPNQMPMYAENALSIITSANKMQFVETLRSRLDDIEKESKRKRVEKVIKKLL